MFKEILVPIDVNDEKDWRKALGTAVTMAETFGARLHLMTVLPTYGLAMVSQYFPAGFEQKSHENARDRLQAIADQHVPQGIAREIIVSQGSIHEQVVEAAKKTACDLIVVGAHRPELSDFFLGANAVQVAQHTDCSVLIVRG